MNHVRYSRHEYAHTLATAQANSERIRHNTKSAIDLPDGGTRYYLATDFRSGFGITASGELIAVFSLVPGRGPSIVSQAVRLGASNLDCFDGHLVALYSNHGFKETHREPNWDPSGPDVVWMSRG